jgi:hypothetical protein
MFNIHVISGPCINFLMKAIELYLTGFYNIEKFVWAFISRSGNPIRTAL